MSSDLAATRQDMNDIKTVTESLHVRMDNLERFAQGIGEDLEHGLREARFSADLAARRGTLQRKALRVVFLAHNRDAWDSIGEVVAIMRESEDFDPVVITIPHHYGGSSEPRGEGRMHRFLSERDVPHLRLRRDQLLWAHELLFALDPDVVFRQSQWDLDVSKAFSAGNLAWTRLALIPYETMNPTRNVPWDDPPVNSALDQQWHRSAWLVFCANEDVREIATAQTLTGGRQFRVVGHPKADALRSTDPLWPMKPTKTRAPRVMWSAHHSILDGWNDFGTFPHVKDDMLNWAREDAGTEFVFTHHPYLRGTVRRADSPLSSSEFRSWLNAWQSLPNTAYWRGAYAPVLAATDVLVTDGPSMITESQVLTTPTVFIERPEHIDFNHIGEQIVAGVHRVPDITTARAVTLELLEDGDPLDAIQRANSLRLFGAPGAAQRVVDTIRREARAEVQPGR